MSTRFTRREVVRLSLVAGAGSLLAACTSQTPAAPPATPTQPTDAPAAATVPAPAAATVPAPATVAPTGGPAVSSYKESPRLTAKVAAGALPPVNERLPIHPAVAIGVDGVGKYGGRMVVGTDRTNLYGVDPGVLTMYNQMWLRFTTGEAVIPNVAEAVEVSEDATTFTVHMREGLRFSNGDPVTADDVMFWYEDVYGNEELTPSKDSVLVVDGEPMTVERIDDYTFAYKFAAPNAPFLLYGIANYRGFNQYYGGHVMPSNYLKQFHIKYNDQAEQLAKAAGRDLWTQHFDNRADMRYNIEVPNLRAHIPTTDQPDGTLYEENPYFHMVDTEGNQIPYIGEVFCDRVTNRDILDARTIAGDYDLAFFHLSATSLPAYVEGAARGDYRVLNLQTGNGSEVIYNVNMTIADPVLREIFQDVRFRQALSLAINREEINELVFFSLATPAQMTVDENSRWYKPEYARSYADFDPDRANALLDEMGLAWNAARTVRMRPDGQPLRASMSLWDSQTPKVPVTELVQEYWRNIGLELTWTQVTRDLMTPRILSNEAEMSVWHGAFATDIGFAMGSFWSVPVFNDEAAWCPLWAQWHQTGGEQGEEPPQHIKDLWAWHSKVRAELDDEAAHNILSSQAENIWTIGTVANGPQPIIARNTLRNVPESGSIPGDVNRLYKYYIEAVYFES